MANKVGRLGLIDSLPQEQRALVRRKIARNKFARYAPLAMELATELHNPGINTEMLKKYGLKMRKEMEKYRADYGIDDADIQNYAIAIGSGDMRTNTEQALDISVSLAVRRLVELHKKESLSADDIKEMKVLNDIAKQSASHIIKQDELIIAAAKAAKQTGEKAASLSDGEVVAESNADVLDYMRDDKKPAGE